MNKGEQIYIIKRLKLIAEESIFSLDTVIHIVKLVMNAAIANSMSPEEMLYLLLKKYVEKDENRISKP